MRVRLWLRRLTLRRHGTPSTALLTAPELIEPLENSSPLCIGALRKDSLVRSEQSFVDARSMFNRDATQKRLDQRFRRGELGQSWKLS